MSVIPDGWYEMAELTPEHGAFCDRIIAHLGSCGDCTLDSLCDGYEQIVDRYRAATPQGRGAGG